VLSRFNRPGSLDALVRGTERFAHRLSHLACVAACLFYALSGLAQQGYPLTGTWTGDWGPTATQRTHITLVMDWDGKKVTGLINPGPDSVPITSVYVDVGTWTVRIEADAKDPSGNPVHINAEGKLEDLGSYHRTIAGTWRQGTVTGDFKITRD
jgi:hypothetical protein